MSDKIKQCWAFHRDGTRCGMPAGHPGDHAVERTWGDDECAMPVQNPVQIPVPMPVPTPEPELKKAPVKCVACNHQHQGGTCKCGCYEFVG